LSLLANIPSVPLSINRRLLSEKKGEIEIVNGTYSLGGWRIRWY
jgi:hypothetical protein